MTSYIKRKPVALAIGAALVGTLAVAGTASAGAFTVTDLAQGYSQFMGEGSCGGDKGKEGKCGAEKKEGEKGAEGKCGEGKCGGAAKGSEGKGKEGKCGEGKCGGSK
jgi:uncharacterized low-complexity protein